LGLLVIGSGLLVGTFFSNNLYRNKCLLRFRPNALIVSQSVGLWFVVYLGVSLALKFNPPISRIFAALSVVFAWASVLAWRFTMIKMLKAFGLSSWLTQRVAFLGWTDAVQRLAQSIQQDAGHVYSIKGIILETSDHKTVGPLLTLPVLGDASNLPKILGDRSVDILVRSDGPWDVDQLIAVSNLCDREMVQFKMIPSRLHSMIAGLHLETISDVPVLGVAEGPLVDPINRVLTRAVDIIGALVGDFCSAARRVWWSCVFGIPRPDHLPPDANRPARKDVQDLENPLHATGCRSTRGGSMGQEGG
jgi:FlaA1/EpsC-like NDP-sugar epimerase